MVTSAIFVTMSSSRWNIASAKAQLSRVVRQARRAPQVLESRGKPVAVVLSIEEYDRVAEHEQQREGYQRFLRACEELRRQGGAELEIPPRRNRRSQFRP
jgi:prevent-host-death family protein